MVSVWCSAGWNYEYVDLALTAAYPVQTTAINTWTNNGVTTSAATTKGDLG